jgi:hypothetical protein
MRKPDRIAYVREFLKQFEALTPARRQTDAIGWIALKLSCSREQAEKWVREAAESL